MKVSRGQFTRAALWPTEPNEEGKGTMFEIFVSGTVQMAGMGTLLTDDAEIARRIREALESAGFDVTVRED